jgi:hypothetical protein
MHDVFSFGLGFLRYVSENKTVSETTVKRLRGQQREVHALPKVIIATKFNHCRSGLRAFFKADGTYTITANYRGAEEQLE